VDLKEENLEERLAARKEDATANLYDESWLQAIPLRSFADRNGLKSQV
jgi:hypothetical protein